MSLRTAGSVSNSYVVRDCHADRARVARIKSDQARNPRTKRMLSGIAEAYERLAQEAEGCCYRSLIKPRGYISERPPRSTAQFKVRTHCLPMNAIAIAFCEINLGLEPSNISYSAMA
jgi:hypothetical protein